MLCSLSSAASGSLYPFYPEYFDNSKICKILKHWENGDKLIPPIVSIFDDEYNKKLGIKGISQNETLRVTDGNNRLKASYSLGSKTIPFIIFDFQKEKMLKLFDVKE